MDYPSVWSISAEIADLAPIFKAGIDGEQWPFLDNGKFGCKDGLAQLRLTENSELIKTLSGLL